MDGEQLFDLFVAHGVTVAEVAAMDLGVVTRQVGEMRRADPDELTQTDGDIARAILAYARAEDDGWHCRHCGALRPHAALRCPSCGIEVGV